MRWHFGGNLQPVRMICEYDWKDCPIAVVSYIWSEIVTDVVDGITGEAQLWRILAVLVLCSILFHVYYKMRFTENKLEKDFVRDDLVKVGFKMQDLELKINILTYKMQYGNWPMPHEIPTPSLNELRNVKLTLSNTSRRNMWTKHHLHGYISKCVRSSEEDKWMRKECLQSDNLIKKSSENLKLLKEARGCRDYEKLVRTADECRKYMDEINESNKSLGLYDNSTDVSDNQCSSEETSHRFLVDPKKWHEIYKSNNRKEEDMSETDLIASNQIYSLPNFKHKDSVFPIDEERQYPFKNSNNRSKLLPPGLSITFLSDKFKALSTSDKGVSNKVKSSTNETLNRVKEKLESLPNIENSDVINNLDVTNDKFKEEKMDESISSECEEEMKVIEEKAGNSPRESKDPQIFYNTLNQSLGNIQRPEAAARTSSLSCKQFDMNKSGEILVNDGSEKLERNINLSFVLSPRAKSAQQTPMETDDDVAPISGTSSHTELSRDSDTDEKSTTTLLREALEFKKALLMQIQEKENECDSDDTFRSKTDNNFRPKLLDIISEEQSAGSSTEKTSRTYILSRTINETNLCEEYQRKGSKTVNLKSDQLIPQNEPPCCGDSKSVVKSSSSEYFSTHNIIDTENPSTQKVGQCVADGDGLREPGLDVVDNRGKKEEADGLKSDRQISKDSNAEPESVAENFHNEANKLRFFKSLSSIISDKAISWNSISESSSDESIAQFVSALTNMESKNMYTVAEEKPTRFNSTDYKGRNLATAGVDLRHRFLSLNAKKTVEEISDSVIIRPKKQEQNKEEVVLKQDLERLQRKQEMLSKLKSLDAFTKPIDISECDLERIENDEASSPLTGRTVVCICRSDSKTKNQALGDKSNSCAGQSVVATELEVKKSLENKKEIVNTKKKNLSKSSITNFSTDTSDSYFDMSNHDFAVSSVILTSQNSNFVGNQRADPTKSDTSSSYVDASDRSVSKIASKSISMENEEPSKHKSSTKTQLIPKSTSSLPSNVKKSVTNSQSEQNQSNRSSNRDASKCWSNLNLDKCNSRAKTPSKSFIPVLKSRVDIPRRGKSMESKTRSRSPTRGSNTPRIQSARSNLNCEKVNEKRVSRQSKSLNMKESYTLSSKNDTTVGEQSMPKPDSANKRENKVVKSVSNVLEKSEPSKPSTAHLTKECTVIYINIISDTEGNEAQTPHGKETKYENHNNDNRQSLSLGNMKSDRNEKRRLDSEYCMDGDEKGSNSSRGFLGDGVRDSDRTSAPTAHKLLSTSTLELSHPARVEQREMEVSVRPSVKNTSTSVSDFPDSSLESKRSFYNPNIEMFDLSNDLVQKEKIVLSEMLTTTTDPNFFECKRPQRLYNKLGLSFQEQSEQL